MKNKRKPESGKIDKIIHEPSRYEIMSILYVIEETNFVFLLRQTEFSRGNLSTHLTKLRNAGFIAIHKEFIKNKPHTSISLTESGRKAFEQYRTLMKQTLDSLPDIQEGNL